MIKRLKYLLLLTVTMANTSIYAQSYVDLVMKADSLYEENDFKGSGKLLDQALQIKTEGFVLYNAACSWARAGEETKAFDYLFKSINYDITDLIDLEVLENDEDLSILKKDEKRWNELLSDFTSKKSGQNLNTGLVKKLANIEVRDQTLRQLMDAAQDKFEPESPYMHFFEDMIRSQDSINLNEVIQILDTYGWLGKDKVGVNGNNTIWLVIQHAPLEVQEKYLPLLQSSVDEGQSQPQDLAYLTDRILLRKNQPQVYGTQIVKNELTGDWELYQVIEPEQLDARRSAVGLEPIASYLKNWGID